MSELGETVKCSCRELRESAQEFIGIKTTVRNWGKFAIILMALLAPVIGAISSVITSKVIANNHNHQHAVAPAPSGERGGQ